MESEENSSTAAVLDEEETSLDGSNLEDDGVGLGLLFYFRSFF